MIDKPVSCWVEKERLNSKIVDCLTIILRTRGCSWRKCLMCGFSISANVSEDDLKKQIDFAISKYGVRDVVKIFTSGSFFDDREVSRGARDYVYSLVDKKLIVESRPEYVFNCDCFDLGFELEVGIGLETSNDFIRNVCINKGFTFEDYERAAEYLIENKAGVRTYLLLKPPFLSEKEAIEDCIQSIKDCLKYSRTISINPVYIPKNTYIEKLWKAKIYRPPWLWSAVKVLRRAFSEIKSKTNNKTNKNEVCIICDPVGAGSVRAVHNCGKCDKDISSAIRKFSISQDIKVLENLKCSCEKTWRKYVNVENTARFNVISELGGE